MKRLASLACAAIALGVVASPSGARGIIVDIDTYDVFGDAVDGQLVYLPYPVDYGAGQGGELAIVLPDGYPYGGIAPGTITNVGLTFTGASGDALFATLTNLASHEQGWPVVYLSNDTQQANVAIPPPSTVSEFYFGLGYPYQNPINPVPEGEIIENYVVTDGAAVFQFIDLSATGAIGDFGLNLICAGACVDIGFNLAGLTFSSSTFDPLSAPPELVTFSFGDGTSSVFNPTGSLSDLTARPSSYFSFVFRNGTPAIPEPSTWAMMLLGFGGVGWSVRRWRSANALPQMG